MPKLTDSQNFLEKIRLEGGRVSNPKLQNLLGWSDDKYWRIHQQHIDAGNMERGKGKGGTVILVDSVNPVAAADVAAVDAKNLTSEFVESTTLNVNEIKDKILLKEFELYTPFLKLLRDNWTTRRQLDQCHCEITAFQGKRDTGGSWTRPDITAVGQKVYEYLPEKALEVFTFEIKAEYDVSIKGVLEALAHREAATRSYVIFYTNGRDFGDFPEALRIEELAARHGVGVIAARDISDIKSWEDISEAIRANPDPDRLEMFIKRALSDEAKSKIRRWF